ncbi:DUF3231 family protein [Metabacillus herbersteinensis]|uniref:DUF3231 family protein n=1 Tax=Metabacillus herbersteinensis TaxID=283816 RepID=A0ABV6GB37_9BACI
MSGSTTAKLTASEIASLWTSYLNDSMAKCVLGQFLQHIEDEAIRSVVQFSYDLSVNHLERLKVIFHEGDLPQPIGFTEEDVNLGASRLFTEIFCLTYVCHMSKVGMLAYSGFVSMSAREDLREYYIAGLIESAKLYNESTEVALSKGVFVRSPFVEVAKHIEFIEDKGYMSGYSLLKKQRTLNAVETSHLWINIQTNLMGMKLALAFAQTSTSKNIQNYMLKGKDISKKHMKIFSSTLLDSNIQPPMPADISITNSTTQTFSDKLMMFHMTLLSAAGTGNYSTAAVASQRSDLVINYERLSVEVAQFAASGANIMIKEKWLEQPPGMYDKEKMAQLKYDPE